MLAAMPPCRKIDFGIFGSSDNGNSEVNGDNINGNGNYEAYNYNISEYGWYRDNFATLGLNMGTHVHNNDINDFVGDNYIDGDNNSDEANNHVAAIETYYSNGTNNQPYAKGNKEESNNTSNYNDTNECTHDNLMYNLSGCGG